MLRLFVVALAICFGTDLEELGVDDECGSTGSCSLTALQLRSRKIQDELYQDFEVSGNRSESKVTFIFTFGAVATSKEPLEIFRSRRAALQGFGATRRRLTILSSHGAQMQAQT